MKYEKIVYSLSALIIIVAAVMNILHIPYGNTIFVIAVLAMMVFQNYHVKQLKRRVSELEKEKRQKS